MKADDAIEVLREFCDDVECTGGLEWNPEERQCGPVACPDWTALAITYQKACEVLSRKPVIATDDEEGSAD